ncbi:hypothetical protein CRG98_007312 [Punica granatum]|uniref:Uncharacterized protein n=1 Tax=Punica granatum TaxID=22663 RepID=A0A2I0KV02_PUNGR|nr:hypothetical protein CRG98_007312 [Punica granatum]
MVLFHRCIFEEQAKERLALIRQWTMLLSRNSWLRARMFASDCRVMNSNPDFGRGFSCRELVGQNGVLTTCPSLFACSEIDHLGSLCRVEGCPNFQSAGLSFGTHVDLFCWIDRGDLMVFEAMQTLFYLGHLTVFEKPFPKVYGLGLTEVLFEWVRIEVSGIWIRVEPGNSRESS